MRITFLTELDNMYIHICWIHPILSSYHNKDEKFAKEGVLLQTFSLIFLNNNCFKIIFNKIFEYNFSE